MALDRNGNESTVHYSLNSIQSQVQMQWNGPHTPTPIVSNKASLLLCPVREKLALRKFLAPVKRRLVLRSGRYICQKERLLRRSADSQGQTVCTFDNDLDPPLTKAQP